MSRGYAEVIEPITRLRGVSGAMVVSAEDGLIVAESLMEGVPGDAVAALAASLTRRLETAIEATGHEAPSFFHLQASRGALLVVPASSELLLVAVADSQVNAGLARIEMLQAVGHLG
jgi:predicted regulator of Ras-like GTPase activity (Roadblock/LC7/MglB family)